MHLRRGFTLIELLVVIAIIAILAVVVVLTLNPAELLRQSRDANRVSDAATLKSAMGLYSEDVLDGTLGSSSVIYISVPDPSATTLAGGNCGLASVASDTYHCAESFAFHAVDGTGWMALDFRKISSGPPFSSLPVDPINTVSSGDYYTYETNGIGYEITMAFESQKYAPNAQNDGGQYPNLYETGTNLKLAPVGIDGTSTNGGVGENPISFGSSVTDISSVTSTYTFSGDAGQSITVAASNQSGVYWSGAGSPFYLLGPGNNVLWSGYTGTGAMLTTQTLPTTGIYTVKLTPPSGTGSVTISLTQPTTGSLSMDSPTTISTSLAGQISYLTFSGDAGQSITVAASNQSGVYWSGAGSPFYLLGPGNNVLWSGYTGTGAMLTTQTLPTTGIYTVKLTPPTGQGGYGGNTNLTLYQNATGTIAFGVPVDVTTTLPGQAVYLSFAGTTDSVVSVTASNQVNVYWSGSGVEFSLLDPSGDVLASAYSGNNPYAITSTTLPTDGTYTVLITPPTGPGGYTGSATFTLNE